MISYKWKLADFEKIKDKPKNLNCFSCFSGGGGSSLGYLLAGIDIVGSLDIDIKQNLIYERNIMPVRNKEKPYFKAGDIRDFLKGAVKKELPDFLYNLDILDASPPCTLFSVANLKADEFKGVMRKYKEGQTEQILDELFITYIELVDALKPKISIAENVEGLLHEKNKPYLEDIIRKFQSIGYKVAYKLLDASKMNVPQRRKRVFFIAVRNDIQTSSADLFNHELKLDLEFNFAPIAVQQLDKGLALDKKISKVFIDLMKHYEEGDKDFRYISRRVHNKTKLFNHKILKPDEVMNSVTSSGRTTIVIDKNNYRLASDMELIQAQTFPIDYKFNKKLQYVLGMSVPPLMIYHLVNRILEQINLKEGE